MTREEARYWLEHKDISDVKFWTAVGVAIDALRQLEQQWIPVSERLPDVAQRVLLSGHGTVMVGMLHSFGKYSLEPRGISYVYPKDDIDAWMPLPTAYREDGGGNE